MRNHYYLIMQTIGLIGGITWESSIIYYKIINQEINRILGRMHSSKCLMYSFDFEEIGTLQLEGNWVQLSNLIIDVAKKLENAGADFIVICSNTMHKVADELQHQISIPLIHIGDVVAEEIITGKIEKVGLLGTRFTMEEGFLISKLTQRDIQVQVPDVKSRSLVHQIIYNELAKGIIKAESREILLKIIGDLSENGAEGIVLGCTELPLIVTPDFTDKILFDTTTIHAKEAVRLSLQSARKSFSAI